MRQHQAQRWLLRYKIVTQIRQILLQHSISKTSNLKEHRVASHGTVFHQSLCSCASTRMTLLFVNSSLIAQLNYNRASRLASSTQQIQKISSEALMTITCRWTSRSTQSTLSKITDHQLISSKVPSTATRTFHNATSLSKTTIRTVQRPLESRMNQAW